MGREIVSIMPVKRTYLIRSLHNFWLNIPATYLPNLTTPFLEEYGRLLGGGVTPGGLPHKILINKIFSQKGQYLNLSQFSWKKYSFVANYWDKNLLNFRHKTAFDVTFSKGSNLCQGSVVWAAPTDVAPPTSEWSTTLLPKVCALY